MISYDGIISLLMLTPLVVGLWFMWEMAGENLGELVKPCSNSPNNKHDWETLVPDKLKKCKYCSTAIEKLHFRDHYEWVKTK